jgi:hypothetical protein
LKSPVCVGLPIGCDIVGRPKTPCKITLLEDRELTGWYLLAQSKEHGFSSL